ncbi:MAG: hypothetical protein R2695_08445 [Acidimicrobiales bacterium]
MAHAKLFADLAEHLRCSCLRRRTSRPRRDPFHFIATTALPGSGSMNAHCDQSTVMPEPWPTLPRAERHLVPPRHRRGERRHPLPTGESSPTSFAEVPNDPKDSMQSFVAFGRLGDPHGTAACGTRQGEPVSPTGIGPCCLRLYTRGVSPAADHWWRVLDDEVRSQLSARMRALCCLGFRQHDPRHLPGRSEPPLMDLSLSDEEQAFRGGRYGVA